MPNVYFLQGDPVTDEQMAQKTSIQGALYLSNDVSGNSNSNRLYIGRTNAAGGIKPIVTPTPFKQIIQFNGATKSSFDGTAEVTTNIQAVSLVSSTNNALARFDGTKGFIKNSTVTLDDNGNINTAGKITAQTFKGNLNGNADTATRTALLNELDLRSTNETPAWYMTNYSRSLKAEFKATNAVGAISDSDASYKLVLTATRWQDSSGGRPIQIAFDNKGIQFRPAQDDTTWSDWKRLVPTDGTGASGTWGISISGNAAAATNATNSSKLYVNTTSADTNYYILGATGTGNQSVYRALNSSGTANTTGVYFNGVTGVLFGAAWNDYAEFRQSNELEAGRVVCETGKGDLILSTERLQPGAEIISDTFGFAIGETNKCKTPIATSGRVLAYPYEDRNTYCAGDAVCAAPGGTVSKMTRDEIINYPDRIIGTVSEIPEYDTWGQSNIKVNNRIWIRIR